MNSAIHWIQQGVTLKRQGKFQEAIIAYQNALPLAHGDEIIETYKAMGKTYFLLNDATGHILIALKLLVYHCTRNTCNQNSYGIAVNLEHLVNSYDGSHFIDIVKRRDENVFVLL